MTAHPAHAFDEIALRSAKDFRVLMNAMASPGRVFSISNHNDSQPPMNNGAMLTALTLCDHETHVWLDDTLSTVEVVESLKFKCGCPITNQKSLADFAFFNSFPDPEDIDAFLIGTSSYPDRSATFIIQVDHLDENGSLTLKGPGIKSTQSLGISSVADGFWRWWHENTMRFPLGVDVVFASQTSVAALPRTVKVLEVN